MGDFGEDDAQAAGGPRTADPGAERLLLRILASRQFAHADRLKKVLRYLVECSADPTRPPPKEHEIAVQAMRRPASFDSRTDPIVRVTIASVRERLQAYFATEGAGERYRLAIPKGQYRVFFTDTDSPQSAPEEHRRAIERFWRPYFRKDAANIIVYTEPLFFRDGKGRYFRDWNINTPPDDLAPIALNFPEAAPADISPTYHYLSAGEMHCLLSLTRMFHEAGVPVETRNSRSARWQELNQSNLILLGSPRTNPFLRSLQGDYPLVARADSIERRGGDVFRGRRFADGALQRMTEYAVVTRRPGVQPDCSVTLIAANHGRAIEGAGHVLTLENRLQELIARLGVDESAALPQTFQFLMRIETIDTDDEVTAVECEACHAQALP
jgi:hypothetical protein